MATLLVSTTRRNCPADEPSGYLYTVDMEQRAVTSRCPIVEPRFRACDPNPRGGLRGGKGIDFHGPEVAVANATEIFRFDSDWTLIRRFSDPLCAGIHDVSYDKESIWVTSSRNDLLFQFSLEGAVLQVINFREPSAGLGTLDWTPENLLAAGRRESAIDFRDPRTHRWEVFDGAHVNSVAVTPDGTVLASLGLIWAKSSKSIFRAKTLLLKLRLWPLLLALNACLALLLRKGTKKHAETILPQPRGTSAVVQLHENGGWSPCLVLKNSTVPSHSLLAGDDGTVIYLHTTDGRVERFDPESGNRLSSTKITDGFLRGAAWTGPSTLVAGSGNELVVVDLAESRVRDRLEISTDPWEYIFAAQVLPRHFAPLPSSLDVSITTSA